jgi:tRNA-2-methylthio-N6-dimethylallyladenosine synthase
MTRICMRIPQGRGTKSANFESQLSNEEKQERLSQLIETQRSITTLKLQSYIGLKSAFIGERISRKSAQEISGKSMLNHMVVVEGTEDLIGKVSDIIIQGVRGATLYGSLY